MAQYRFRTEPQRPKSPVEIQKGWFPVIKVMSNQYEIFNDVLQDARLLFDAIRKGKFHLARFILEASQGDLPNSADIRGKTPLIIACSIKEQLRRKTTVELLLNQGANVNIKDDSGRTALSYACELKCNEMVDILIRHKDVDPDIPDSKGNTPLLYSTMVGNDVATDLLTRHFRRLGLLVDHVNNEGYTALLMACRHGNISCARILAQQGMASLLHRDRMRGYSAQDWLALKGYTLEDITPTESRVRSKSRFVRALSIARLIVPRERLDEVMKFDEERVKLGGERGAETRKQTYSHAKPRLHKRNGAKISRRIADILDAADRESVLIDSDVRRVAKHGTKHGKVPDHRDILSKGNVVVLPPLNGEVPRARTANHDPKPPRQKLRHQYSENFRSNALPKEFVYLNNPTKADDTDNDDFPTDVDEVYDESDYSEEEDLYTDTEELF